MKELSKTGAYVPEILALEILSKLPVKFLTRFRLVCKDWSLSFHSPLFITKHHQNNLRNNKLNFLLKRSHGSTRDNIFYFSQLSTEKDFSVNHNIHLPFFENYLYTPDVYGPCNGLLCLRENDRVALWNPSTREFKTLPESSVQRPPDLYYTAFDHCFGFGYDPQTDDYKIVRFVFNKVFNKVLDDEYESKMQVELYSLKSDSWTEIVEPDGLPYGGAVFNTYVNGFYYWQALGDFDKLVLAFDMVDEKFSTLPMPEFDVPLTQYYWELLEFNGLLGAIVYPIKGSEKSFDLWVMNGCWSKQFSIESVRGVERPLWFWKNGELFLASSDHELMMFPPHESLKIWVSMLMKDQCKLLLMLRASFHSVEDQSMRNV
ncbi:F-box/kelch-repeat protein At3g23880-like [Hibiscus syriacus]|nr:F-box/kelch-repeat protein At3g23880-like [Hibiscus syriacus]